MSYGSIPLSRRFFLGVLITSLATLVASALSGCGGGTRGTGDELRTVIVGTIQDRSGAPLANATVTQLETGDETLTDERGAFSLAVKVEGDEANLLIEKGDFQAMTSLDGLSESTGEDPIEFAITVDLVAGVVTDVDVVEVSPFPGTPTPDPTNEPGDSNSIPKHKLSGIVVNHNGTPLGGVQISVASGGSTVSLGNGRFQFSVRTAAPSIRVFVRSGGNRGSFVVNGLPTNRDAKISLRVKVNDTVLPVGPGEVPTEFSVSLIDIDIR